MRHTRYIYIYIYIEREREKDGYNMTYSKYFLKKAKVYIKKKYSKI